MTRKLYTDLQREIDKRKDSLNLQIQEETSLKLELEKKSKEIEFINDQLSMMTTKNAEYEIAIKRKVQENRNLFEDLQKVEREKAALLDVERKKLDGENFAKFKIKEAEKDI